MFLLWIHGQVILFSECLLLSIILLKYILLGEKMISWSEVDTMTFCDNITQFLSEHPSPGGNIANATPNNFDKVKKMLLLTNY